MTLFYRKTRERLQHHLNIDRVAAEGNKSKHVHMFQLMVDKMDKQPYNINQKHDIMELFNNLDNFPLLQILWSQLEQQQWKAELQHLSKYLQPKVHH